MPHLIDAARSQEEKAIIDQQNCQIGNEIRNFLCGRQGNSRPFDGSNRIFKRRRLRDFHLGHKRPHFLLRRRFNLLAARNQPITCKRHLSIAQVPIGKRYTIEQVANGGAIMCKARRVLSHLDNLIKTL